LSVGGLTVFKIADGFIVVEEEVVVVIP
jgi:hypothetical protein